MPPVWAEGGLWSCLEDLARWISFQLRGHHAAAGLTVLAAASLREMHQPRYLAADDWTSAWGISWCGNRRDDVVWIQHSGGLPGFTNTVCFDPLNQVGAIVFLSGTTGSTELAFDLASTARSLIRATPPRIEVPEPTPGQYRSLLGIYARPGLGGWILRLEWRDRNLTFTTPEATGWHVTLTPTSDPDVFTPEPGSGFPGETVRFQRLADGRVASVFLMDSTFVRLDRLAAWTALTPPAPARYRHWPFGCCSSSGSTRGRKHDHLPQTRWQHHRRPMPLNLRHPWSASSMPQIH